MKEITKQLRDHSITILPLAPSAIYVYWNLSRHRLQMIAGYIQQDESKVQKGIRLYQKKDRDDHGSEYRDIIFQEQGNSCYLSNLQEDHIYLVEFGLYFSGQFCPILRSDWVQVSRAIFSSSQQLPHPHHH
ncbi:DUF4912 domain-containing protein [Brevibacillus daliensis]|uniref:DUF4912 domain-containing protein n=1 Tax=Brevibacillus daliensis TaxID=2892995 RepID=UPI001E44BCB4|nr:DUF4912 domain-containing protein [Brevibacillus daliensis]